MYRLVVVVVVVFFFPTRHKLESSERRELQLRKHLHEIGR